jgi:hypothetical protein
MLPETASSLLIVAGLAVAVYLLTRRKYAVGWVESASADADPRGSVHPSSFRLHPSSSDNAPPELLRWQIEMHDTARELKGQLDCKLSALQALVALARRESDRLEAAILRAEQLDISAPQGTLAQLQNLADPASLADPTALATAAGYLSPLPGCTDSDLFAANRRLLELSRLADQGLSPAEISHLLSLPLGEVELLLSLRPA